MRKETVRHEWETYRDQELKRARTFLDAHGIVLDDTQPHIAGERYLMSGCKLVLLGTGKENGVRVVIKISSHKDGRREIKHERACRETLRTIKFAYRTFHSPDEILFEDRDGLTVLITAYIAQNKPFLTRPIEEQFSLALEAFKTQESVHAATSSHIQHVRRVFGVWRANDYLKSFDLFRSRTFKNCPDNHALSEALEQVGNTLITHERDIERYCGFLTHEDFALHNIRVSGTMLYLIDHASLRFGNKHESWARFMNYMLLYNHELERALDLYIKNNRSHEENTSLKLMRMYKIVELLAYHTCAYAASRDSVRELSLARVIFWTDVLTTLHADEAVSESRIEAYKRVRDSLRSDEEKERQRALQQL